MKTLQTSDPGAFMLNAFPSTLSPHSSRATLARFKARVTKGVTDASHALLRGLAFLGLASTAIVGCIHCCWLTRHLASRKTFLRRLHEFAFQQSMVAALRLDISCFNPKINRRLHRQVLVLGRQYGASAATLELVAKFISEVLLNARGAIPFWHRMIARCAFHHWMPYVRLARDSFLAPRSTAAFDYLRHLQEQTVSCLPSSTQDLVRWKECYLKCALLLDRLGRREEALTAYRAVLDIEPHNACANYAQALHGLIDDTLAHHATNVSFANDGRPKLLVTAVFWGAEFTSLFCRLGLATFLDAIRRAELCVRFDMHVVLATSAADLAFLRAHPVYARLCTYQHSFIDIASVLPSAAVTHVEGIQYYLSGAIQALFAELARRLNAGLISIPADSVFAANAGEVITHHVLQGCQAVVVTGVRTNRRNLLGTLAAKGDDAMLAAPDQRSLTVHAFANLHQEVHAHNMIRKRGLALPGMAFWPLNDGKMIGHFFHLHPIYVSASALQQFKLHFFDFIDGDFLGKLLPPSQYANVKVLTKADEVFMWELTCEEVTFPAKHSKAQLMRAARVWLFPTGLRPINQYFFKHRIHFGGEPTRTTWRERAADRWVRRVFELVRRFDRQQSNGQPAVLANGDLDQVT